MVDPISTNQDWRLGCVSLFRLFLFCQVGFHAPGEFAPGEQDAMPAALAFQADIRAQANHGPLVRAARMWLAQAHMIVQLQVGKHKWIIPLGVEGASLPGL